MRVAALVLVALQGASVAEDQHDTLRRSVVRIAGVRPVPGVEMAVEGGGFLVEEGFLVTSLHVLIGARTARVILEDNRVFPVTEVAAFDEFWDLVLLRADLPDGAVVPLPLIAKPPEPGDLLQVPLLDHLTDDTESIEGEPRALIVRKGVALAPTEYSRGEDVTVLLSAEVGDSGSPLLGTDDAGVLAVLSSIEGYSASDRVVTHGTPAVRVRALVDATIDGTARATSFDRWQHEHVMDPRVLIEGAYELRERDSMFRSMLEFMVNRADKLGRPVAREAFRYQAMSKHQQAIFAEGEEEERLLRGVLEWTRRAVDDGAVLSMFDERCLGSTLLLRGRAHRRLEEPEAAVIAFTAADALGQIDAVVELGDIAIERGDEGMARKQLRRLGELVGQEDRAYVELKGRLRDAF